MKKPLALLAIACLSLGLSGCFLRPYMVPIQQGQIISSQEVDKLKPGMSKQQVEYILGSPMINNPYDPNTWYYVYTLEQDYLPRAQNKLILHFSNDKLDSISGDYPPPSQLQY
jgi:outer membrane protein assembly factor BamE